MSILYWHGSFYLLIKASKALIDNEHTEIRFFSFPKGGSISKEYYEMETPFVMLEGSAKIVYSKDDEKVINRGDINVVIVKNISNSKL